VKVGGRGFPWTFAIRLGIQLMKALAIIANHLPKTSPATSIALGIGISTYELGRNMNFQITARCIHAQL
jgi:hypothetical protein